MIFLTIVMTFTPHSTPVKGCGRDTIGGADTFRRRHAPVTVERQYI